MIEDSLVGLRAAKVPLPSLKGLVKKLAKKLAKKLVKNLVKSWSNAGQELVTSWSKCAQPRNPRPAPPAFATTNDG